MHFVKIRSCTLYKVAHWLLPNKTEDGGTFLRANGEPSAMRRRRWSSRGGWTPEWRARCRSHGPRGSWGWWKWITNKHKSGKLQASAPELPRLRKTIKPRQTLWRQRGREKAKKNWWGGGELTGSQKATETEPQCFHSPRLVCGSPILIFSPAPSAGIKVNSLTAPLAGEMTTLRLHYGGGSGILACRLWQRLLDTPDAPEIREQELDDSRGRR